MKRLLLSIAISLLSLSDLTSQQALDLENFLQIVRSSNPQLQSIELERQVAAADLLQAGAAFDLFTKAKVDWKSTGEKDKLRSVDIGVELPLATTFGPRLSSSLRNADGSQVNPENTTDGSSELAVGLQLPLWQGIVTDSRRTSLEKAQLRPDAAKASIDQERMVLLRTASHRYWDWAESADVVAVQRELLNIAEQRFQQIAARARAGEVPAIDTVEALQELERRRGDYYRSERQLEQASISARNFVWTGSSALLDQNMSPKSLPAVDVVTDSQVASDRESALRKRPELRRLAIQERLSSVDLQLSQELQKPLIEAQGQYLTRALSGDNQNSFKIGLQFSHPLFTRGSRAQEELARVALERVSLSQRLAQRQIHADIDDAVSALRKAQIRIATAEREVAYAEIMRTSELAKWNSGESTLIIVNIRERSLAEARIRLLNAKADYWRAHAVYRWATAQL